MSLTLKLRIAEAWRSDNKKDKILKTILNTYLAQSFYHRNGKLLLELDQFFGH